jgi:predicted RNA-binding Zn-ribbon protein involved in translation (DUF1610 family)
MIRRCPLCGATLAQVRTDVFQCINCGDYSTQIKRWPIVPRAAQEGKR